MLNKSPFYFGLIKKYVIFMGSILDDIYIERTNNGQVSQRIKVPVEYSTKEKMLARLQSDPQVDRPYASLLPRIAFELVNFRYAEDRKLNSINRQSQSISSNPNKMKYIYNSVPYDFDFNAYVVVKNAEDGAKIIEQILPFFTPEWTATLNLIPEMDISKDTPVILRGATLEDFYPEDYKVRRALVWNLGFTIRGELYGPTYIKPIIKFVDVTTSVSENSDPVIELTVQPGLTSNGQPTTVINNSINKNEIKISDDYGFIVNIEDFT